MTKVAVANENGDLSGKVYENYISKVEDILERIGQVNNDRVSSKN